MENEKTIFSYIREVFSIFGFSMLCLMSITVLFGEDAKEISSFFQLGNQGIPIDIVIELFFLAIGIIVLKWVLFTDRWIKNLSVIKRTIGMVLGIVLMFSVFIIQFGWFPVDTWEPWAMFLISFGICFAVSTFVSVLSEKAKNKKLQDALENMQEKWGKEDE